MGAQSLAQHGAWGQTLASHELPGLLPIGVLAWHPHGITWSPRHRGPKWHCRIPTALLHPHGITWSPQHSGAPSAPNGIVGSLWLWMLLVPWPFSCGFCGHRTLLVVRTGMGSEQEHLGQRQPQGTAHPCRRHSQRWTLLFTHLSLSSSLPPCSALAPAQAQLCPSSLQALPAPCPPGMSRASPCPGTRCGHHGAKAGVTQPCSCPAILVC